MGERAPAAVKRPPARRLPFARQRSAGGVVEREGRVLLIATGGGPRWQLPKGRIEPGESAEQAAVREVREETGVTGEIRAPLAGIDYVFVEDGRRIRKHVDFFLLRYLAGSETDHDPREVSAARWFAWPEAIATLTHESERRLVERARRLVEELSPA
jgi:8-oxo-dGTP pyrophosphatase MutT (NUDIX family)